MSGGDATTLGNGVQAAGEQVDEQEEHRQLVLLDSIARPKGHPVPGEIVRVSARFVLLLNLAPRVNGDDRAMPAIDLTISTTTVTIASSDDTIVVSS